MSFINLEPETYTVLRGWIYSIRTMRKNTFIDLRLQLPTHIHEEYSHKKLILFIL